MYFILWVEGHNIIQIVAKNNNTVLFFFFVIICIITTTITERLLLRVLLFGHFVDLIRNMTPTIKDERVAILN